MEGTQETSSLITRSDFRAVKQEDPVATCCGVESRALAKVPLIGTALRKKAPGEEVRSSSSLRSATLHMRMLRAEALVL